MKFKLEYLTVWNFRKSGNSRNKLHGGNIDEIIKSQESKSRARLVKLCFGRDVD